MYFCPHCGNEVESNEIFCVTCGERLPNNIDQRMVKAKSKSKHWLLPIFTFIICCLFIGSFFGILHHKQEKALELFEDASQIALVGDYQQAKELTANVISLYSAFPQANDLDQFLNVAITIEQSFTEASKLREEGKYTEALEILLQSEEQLVNFNGELVTKIRDKINILKNETRMDEISSIYQDEPDRNQLKVLLWELERISGEKADELKLDISDKLVSITYQEGTALIQEFQFSQAKQLVEDTLNFVQDSNSLNSLKKTIEKEQLAFENQQQERIEQALSAYESEETHNKEHGIEILRIHTETENEKVKVVGEIESVATVPLHSVLIHYELVDEEQNVIRTNEVYIQPETLYPQEKGSFEFIHVDSDIADQQVTAKVKDITWYLERN